ncbi:AAA family ATPase [candidate division CSSED10-310 bacterium]|uniref:AAA family ATPase n=1 Tax=candidate division CSSED10-310 bacterium TaxID=2855610 RepID=A0ABV6YW91_UNCC1
MTIITISKGSYIKGTAVAEGVAAQLGYECISREILLEAAELFNISELKLVHAIRDAPSLLDKFTHGKLSYITYIQAALTEHVKKDNIVYHGFAGHLLLKGISHVMKVRVIAKLENRVAAVMERERLSEFEAQKMISKNDEERRKWTQWLYGVDPCDPTLYDLIIQIDKISVAEAIDLICQTGALPAFQTSTNTQQNMDDLALACLAKSKLIDLDPQVAVTAEFGNVLVYTKSEDRKAHRLDERASALLHELENVYNVEVRVGETVPSNAV